jgi:hypothetical protein
MAQEGDSKLFPSDSWLAQEFDKLHNEHRKIMDAIEGLQLVVTPELEAAINRAATLAHDIDIKVPDPTTPPSPHKKG